MSLYLIPGLGFDDRIFKKLNLRKYQAQYLNWIAPHKKETFQHYAKRLAEEIPKETKALTLIGHSLGGMVSQEIARIRPVEKIILISSIKSRAELPAHFKVIRPFHLQRFFTKELTFSTFRFWGKRQDYVTPEEQDLFKDMVGQHSNDYLQWALGALSAWETPPFNQNTQVVQIHGDGDKTFPIKKIQQPDHIIEDAGHFMVYREPEKINAIIEAVLKPSVV